MFCCKEENILKLYGHIWGGMNHEPLFASSHSTRHIQVMIKTIVSVPKNAFL